jgi:hypothetical protein
MSIGPLSFVMSAADVEEMIQILGDETVPIKRTSRPKFFWWPEKCGVTRKLLWFKNGYEVDIAWSDGRRESLPFGASNSGYQPKPPRIRHTKTYYCNEAFFVAALKDFK